EAVRVEEVQEAHVIALTMIPPEDPRGWWAMQSAWEKWAGRFLGLSENAVHFDASPARGAAWGARQAWGSDYASLVAWARAACLAGAGPAPPREVPPVPFVASGRAAA